MMEVNAYYGRRRRRRRPERWLWSYLYPTTAGVPASWSHTFSLAPYAGDYPAQLTVVLLGALSNARYPDHHATIRLNGTQVADVSGMGSPGRRAGFGSQGLLQAGDNTLTVECPNDTGVGYDYMYVDRAELEFAGTFVAVDDVLSFGYEASGPGSSRPVGSRANQLAVYDVTNPAAPVRIQARQRDRARALTRPYSRTRWLRPGTTGPWRAPPTGPWRPSTSRRTRPRT